jgi:hypothetical protein
VVAPAETARLVKGSSVEEVLMSEVIAVIQPGRSARRSPAE